MNQGSKPEALKLPEEIITSILHDTDIEKEIMNKTLFAQELKPTTDKQNFVNLEGFKTDNEIINQVKRKPKKWEIIFASYLLTED